MDREKEKFRLKFLSLFYLQKLYVWNIILPLVYFCVFYMGFKFTKLEIDGLVIAEPDVFADNRGFFMETYKKSLFSTNGIEVEFSQDNHSYSKEGVLRGLHFQKEPYGQDKLVRCIKGEIYDVAVDLRKNSPTFGKWYGLNLSEENKKMFYIPRGFAHGFYVLSETAEVSYKVSGEYVPSANCGVLWNDPEIGIDWGVIKPILSEQDAKWPTLAEIKEQLWKY